MIKKLNEYFSQTLTGSSFNSSNGVFKVNYHPYRDLSVDSTSSPDPSKYIKDSDYMVGDFVKANVKGKKNKVIGEVIGTRVSEDGKYSMIIIKSVKTQRVYNAIPGTIEFNLDTGNIRTPGSANVTAGERVAQNARYSGGNVIWGSLESNRSHINSLNEMDDLIIGPMGTGYKFKISDDDKMDYPKIMDDGNIHINRTSNPSELEDFIKSIEIEFFIHNHEDIKEISSVIKDLLCIMSLRNKNEEAASKLSISRFANRNDISYGEAKDLYEKDAIEILKKFGGWE